MNKLPRPVFWTSLLVAVLLAGVLAACSPTPTVDQAQVPHDSCGPIEPTDAEVKKVLTFGEGLFNSADWVKSYTVDPYKVTLTRRNDAVQAIAYSEYLIFTCGYSQTDLGNYFNDEGFNIIFSDYESHTLAKFCEQSGTSLYEYDLVDSNINYKARYWVKQEDEKHIFVYMLVFPQSDPGSLDTFSKQLFPLLTTCP
ncbi:MAG: hypothetical protein HYZ25_08560 [Chloroflexi bacterium]|nr:hypothetical protein [Chloroflexota bacterium]